PTAIGRAGYRRHQSSGNRCRDRERSASPLAAPRLRSAPRLLAATAGGIAAAKSNRLALTSLSLLRIGRVRLRTEARHAPTGVRYEPPTVGDALPGVRQHFPEVRHGLAE